MIDEAAPLPEQPVPLPPVRDTGPARSGEVLPARSRLSLKSLVLPLPRIPKRAIFAVGICAGLAAPTLTRHLAGRALLATVGNRHRSIAETATLEIIRVTYASRHRGGAATAVGRLLHELTR